MTGTQLEQKPAWLELPEKESYWTCTGTDKLPRRWFWQRRRHVPGWRGLFYTKEDAEAYASIPSNCWMWDRRPAFAISLQEAMRLARQGGDLGVRVLSYQAGAWRVVKKYPAGVPLREVEE